MKETAIKNEDYFNHTRHISDLKAGPVYSLCNCCITGYKNTTGLYTKLLCVTATCHLLPQKHSRHILLTHTAVSYLCVHHKEKNEYQM